MANDGVGVGIGIGWFVVFGLVMTLSGYPLADAR